jgi:uncharacterized repeat protein (TIGR04076 family)
MSKIIDKEVLSHPLCARMAEEKERGLKLLYDATDNRCRYHPLNSGNKQVSLLSQGMCPTAFLNLYPTLLALHCNHDQSKLKMNPAGEIISCPLGSEGVSFRVYSLKIKFNLWAYFKNFLRWVLNFLYPVEIPDKDVFIKAVDEGRGCSVGITRGQDFYFNLDQKDELCPAAFTSIYPYLDIEKNNFIAGCPDYRTQVTFSILDKSNDTKHVNDKLCDQYSTRIKLKRTMGDFNFPIKMDQWYSVDKLIKSSGITCYTSFHIAYPYFYILCHGGQLAFLSPDRQTAGICCPNTSFAVQYKVTKDSQGTYKYACIKTHTDCPRGIGLNDEVIMDNFENSLPYYRGLYEIYTVIKKMELSHKTSEEPPLEVEITSKNGDQATEWSIRRDI